MNRKGKRRRLGIVVALAAVTALAVTSATSARTQAEQVATGKASPMRLLASAGPSQQLFDGNIQEGNCDIDNQGPDDKSAEQVLGLPSGAWLNISGAYSVSDSGLVTWSSSTPVEVVVVKQANGGVAYLYSPPATSGAVQSKFPNGEPANDVSHVVFCGRAQAPPTKGKLQVVKVLAGAVPSGVDATDFSFSVDGGPAVGFDADATSDLFEFGAGTSHDVTEPEANGAGYTTTYSDACTDGVVVADQTITCTITNTFATPEPGEVTLTKTAGATWVRSSTWDIVKGGSVKSAASKSGNGVFEWTVRWTKTTTNTYAVSGTILIQNSLDATLSETELDDTLDLDALDCTDGWEPGDQILAGATIQCSYLAHLDAPESGTNHVELTATAGGEKSIDENASADYSFGAGPNDITDASVYVDDPRFQYSQLVSDGGTKTFQEPIMCSGGTFVNEAKLYAAGEGKGPQIDTSGVVSVTVAAVDCSTPGTPSNPGTPSTPTTTPTPTPTPTPPAAAPPAAVPPATVAPYVPPRIRKPSVKVVKVKAAAKPNVCLKLQVRGTKMLTAGKRAIVGFAVTKAGKPVAGTAVLLKGAGIYKVVKTSRQGLARTSVAPRQAGVVAASITGTAHGCNSARIGVVGVFEPPVTG